MNAARGQLAFISKQLLFQLKHLNIHNYKRNEVPEQTSDNITVVSKQPLLLGFKLHPGLPGVGETVQSHIQCYRPNSANKYHLYPDPPLTISQ